MKVIIMRKPYQKPALMFEDFRLMDAVAASCIVPAQHDNKYSCAWYNEDFEVNIYDSLMVAACEFDEIAVEVPQDVVFPS